MEIVAGDYVAFMRVRRDNLHLFTDNAINKGKGRSGGVCAYVRNDVTCYIYCPVLYQQPLGLKLLKFCGWNASLSVVITTLQALRSV